MPKVQSALPLKTHLSRAWESQLASQEERMDRWRDVEMYDGEQYTQSEIDKAGDLELLTINRIFPVINLILGNQAVNALDIVAKGRTQDDSEISQVMTEGIKFVLDQNAGMYLIANAFKDQIVPGFGSLFVGKNPDPRKEKIQVAYRDWKELWWDPFCTQGPWFNPASCKYVFHQKWVDLEDLIAVVPSKAAEIKDRYNTLADGSVEIDLYSDYSLDLANEEEELKRFLSGGHWTDVQRRRVRPVEMWYTVMEKLWFAIFPDGQTVMLKEDMAPNEQYELIRSSQEMVSATVKRMRVCLFVADLMLRDMWSPLHHDEFPFVPFVGYLDRHNYPFGVPRPLRDPQREVNKRRSMILGQLRSRRVIMEENVVDGGENAQQKVYQEANKLDGFILVKEGKINAIQIEEMADKSPLQAQFMLQSEEEIQQISGANAEMSGYESNAESGVAIERRKLQGETMTATLFQNLRRSMERLGTHIVNAIQNNWKGEKILRITDRLSGAERFVALNQPEMGQDGQIHVKHNITQGKYDIVISDAPSTDTTREANLNLIIEWVKKSPPEIIPQLMNLAFEMSNLPNKETLLAKIRPILGVAPGDEDLSPEEIKQRTLEELEAQKAQEQEAAELAKQDAMLELEKKRLENALLEQELQQGGQNAGPAKTGEDAAAKRTAKSRKVAQIIALREAKNPPATSGETGKNMPRKAAQGGAKK